MFRTFLLFTLLVVSIRAFSPIVVHQSKSTALYSTVDRRTAVVTAAATAAAALLGPQLAGALSSIPADNEIVKEQQAVTDKLDVNNAPVANYMQLPGMYPTIAGKIANNGPYGSVNDIFKLTSLSSQEKATIKKYQSELTATTPTGMDTMRGRDPYRRSFNDSDEVGKLPFKL